MLKGLTWSIYDSLDNNIFICTIPMKKFHIHCNHLNPSNIMTETNEIWTFGITFNLQSKKSINDDRLRSNLLHLLDYYLHASSNTNDSIKKYEHRKILSTRFHIIKLSLKMLYMANKLIQLNLLERILLILKMEALKLSDRVTLYRPRV